jgi:cystathionine beta-lyase
MGTIKYNFDEQVDRKGTNCLKYDALGKMFGKSDLLPLWVADTDFKTPDFIVNAIKERAEHEIFGYTFRSDSYTDVVVNWMRQRHDWIIKSKWLSFSPGVVAALTIGVETFSNPGDGVIVQPPVYFPFFETVKGTGCNMIENPLKLENGRYTFDFDDLKQKIDEKTKILLLCNPHNPGGMVWTKKELTELTNICLENNIMIISDEIHSDLIYKGHKHIPLASISDEIAQNCMVCMAPSKTFNVAGLATSVVVIPNKEKLLQYEKALGVAHLGMGNIFGAVALEAAYKYGADWLDQLLDYLWENYLLLEEFFKIKLPRVKVMKPEATFLVWLDFRDYGMANKELHQFVMNKAGVALNDGGRFGEEGDGWLRLNIGCTRETLQKALAQLEKAFA